MFRAVKFFCALILGLSLSQLKGSDPGQAAMDFLGKVRNGKLDLHPGGDTALLEQITDRKRESIQKRIARLGAELREGELKLGEVKEDGGFAAAMILKSSGFDSAEIQVFPIALVKRGDKWLAAPVPASFENAVAGYTVPLKKRLVALENWMTRERVTGLEKLASELAARTRDMIRNSIGGEELEGDDLGKITDRFLEACAKGDRAAILGFLGGLSDPLPTDWGARLEASKAAISDHAGWRWLVSPEVVRVRVQEKRDKKGGLVSIACLDPKRAATTGIRGVDLAFSRDTAAGPWRIDLPEFLASESPAASDGDPNEALLAGFSEKLREQDPAVYSESARAAGVALMDALKTDCLRETLRRIDLGASPREGDKKCAEAAEVWWSLHAPGAYRVPVELGFREEGSLAVISYQWFSLFEPDRFELGALIFTKTDKGWVWCPGKIPKASNRDHEALLKWIEGMEPEWSLSWREILLRPTVKLDRVDFGKMPTDEEVEKLVGIWLNALERKDLGAVLSCSAWLSDGKSFPTSLLPNIRHEISGSNLAEPKLFRIHRSASWCAATIRRVSGDQTLDMLIPIVMTSRGARLLPEIDLISGERDLLNKATFRRLGKIIEAGVVSELETLFANSMKEVD